MLRALYPFPGEPLQRVVSVSVSVPVVVVVVVMVVDRVFGVGVGGGVGVTVVPTCHVCVSSSLLQHQYER